MNKEYIRILEKEGFRKEITYKGHNALVLRVNPETSGHLCGYVEVNKQLDYNDYVNEVDVHGGLTFSGELINEKGFWLGFDTAHARDLQPAYDDNDMWKSFGYKYRDMEYVEGEIKSMIDQLIKMEVI